MILFLHPQAKLMRATPILDYLVVNRCLELLVHLAVAVRLV
jgi:hypothetical protein